MGKGSPVARFHVPVVYPKRLITVLLRLFKLAQLQVTESSGVTRELSMMKGKDTIPINLTAKENQKIAHEVCIYRPQLFLNSYLTLKYNHGIFWQHM